MCFQAEIVSKYNICVAIVGSVCEGCVSRKPRKHSWVHHGIMFKYGCHIHTVYRRPWTHGLSDGRQVQDLLWFDLALLRSTQNSVACPMSWPDRPLISRAFCGVATIDGVVSCVFPVRIKRRQRVTCPSMNGPPRG